MECGTIVHVNRLCVCVCMCVQAQQSLLGGEELGEAFVAELITEKLGSPEIKHYGIAYA